MFSSGSLSDPFALPHPDRDAYPSQKDPRGRGQRPVSSGPGVGVFICAGQSNIGNWSEGAYVATSAAIDNLNIWDGGNYATSDPVLGCDGSMSNWTRRFADKLIMAGTYTRVVLVPCAMGGTSSAEWLPGAQYFPRLITAFRRCAAVDLNPTAVLWQQGEAGPDNSTLSYQANITSIIGAVRGEGFNSPWLLGKSTWTQTGSKAAIRAAVDALVSADPLIFMGGDTDDLTASFRQVDSPHFNAAGAEQCSIRWRDAFLSSGISS